MTPNETINELTRLTREYITAQDEADAPLCLHKYRGRVRELVKKKQRIRAIDARNALEAALNTAEAFQADNYCEVQLSHETAQNIWHLGKVVSTANGKPLLVVLVDSNRDVVEYNPHNIAHARATAFLWSAIRRAG